MNFADLGLDPSLLRAVSSEGYTSPTPIQSEAIPHVLRGCDVLGCAQTGTGKTAAFALPILHRLMQSGAGQPPRDRGSRGPSRFPRVLVLSPTRELAGQIGDSFRTYGRHTGLRHTVVFGGVSQQPQVRDLQRGVDILVATPGRLVDLMGQGFVDVSRVGIYVLDEADRMLDMGFLPDLRRVQAKLPADRQTLFFSATMPDAIRQLADSLLSDPVQIRIAPVKATTALIAESVCFVPKQAKSQLLTDLLTGEGVVRAMVFTRTKHGADRVARHLNQAGIRAEAMHGNKSQSARQRTLAGFRSERPPVLVATDVAARGIDVDGVSHVFNYDLPHEPEMYVHRIGRTGRAGAAGIAVSFCDDQERKLLQSIERLIRRKLLVEQSVAASEATGDAAATSRGSQEPPRQSAERRWKTAKPRSSRPSNRTVAGKGRRW
ncbi:MAG: DEAD/DEAH box helicase [Pirellulaceae bacterium]|nr:DEAD/DEAH box helicase [Pirellulaceae bacterium]